MPTMRTERRCPSPQHPDGRTNDQRRALFHLCTYFSSFRSSHRLLLVAGLNIDSTETIAHPTKQRRGAGSGAGISLLELDVQLLAAVHPPIDLVDLPPDLGLPLLVRLDSDLDNPVAPSRLDRNILVVRLALGLLHVGRVDLVR